MSKDIKNPVRETRRYVGIDLGDKKSRVCIVGEQGEVVSQEWVVTTPEAFLKRFHGQPGMRIAMELGTHSRWDCWESAGTTCGWRTHGNWRSSPPAMPRATSGMRGRWRSCYGQIRGCCPPSSIEPKTCRWT